MNPLVNSAYAANGGFTPFTAFEPFILLAVFAAVFYFFLWRPQAKRTKAHKELIATLKKGDEVAIAGGVVGTIRKVDDTFVTLEVDKGVNLKVQKTSITLSLPKGTIKGI